MSNKTRDSVGYPSVFSRCARRVGLLPSMKRSVKSRAYDGLQRRGRGAFTLVEVILSIAISAMVLFGCVAILFDMTRVLDFYERGWSLRSHVDGVEKFLRTCLMNSTVSKPSLFGQTLASNSAKTIYLANDPQNGSLGGYYIAFGVEEDDPIFVSPFEFSPEKICFLEFDNDELRIVWRFVVSEDKNSDPAIYSTLISKWVKSLSYFYYDDLSGWQEEKDIRTSNSSTMMPSYVKIVFEKDGETIERLISLEGLLDFQLSK